MKLSPAELSFFRDSLSANPPIRPDARAPTQFRPLDISAGFLPSANGSARVRTADGSEVIVGVKAKVKRSVPAVLVEVSIPGLRDDHGLPAVLASTIRDSLTDVSKSLQLSSHFSFLLYIDCEVVASANANPLTLVSLGVYVALQNTRLPKLTSSPHDDTAEEIPTFDDDWASATVLCSNPPVLLLAAVVGSNVFLDPSPEEEAVAEAGVLVAYQNGKVRPPYRLFDVSGCRTQGLDLQILQAVAGASREAGLSLVELLEGVQEGIF